MHGWTNKWIEDQGLKQKMSQQTVLLALHEPDSGKVHKQRRVAND